MGRTSTHSLNPLRWIQTNNSEESFDGGDDVKEGDRVRPFSPMDRLFHDPGPNIYIVAIFGMKTPINVDLFKSELVHVMAKNRRFYSLQVMKKENGSMKWVPTNMKIDNHVIVPELDANMESSDKFVKDYISNLSKSRIDCSKPLWDLHILNTKTSDAQGTCVFRFHHSLGDGVSLMNLMLSSSRKASDPEALPTLPGGDKLGNRSKLITGFKTLLMVLWNSAVAGLMLLLSSLFLEDTKTPLRGSPGTQNRPRRFALTSVSLNDIKMVKRAMGVTVNDVILGVLHAGLYRYLNRKYGAGENSNKVPKNIRFHAMFFFNLRASMKVEVSSNTTRSRGSWGWGNKVGAILLPLNMTPKEDPLDYVRDIKKIMERKKASFEPFFTPIVTNFLIKIFGVKAALKVIYRVQSSPSLWFSNVPGPQEEIVLGGHEVAYLVPTCYGLPTALLIHAVSYVDKLTFAVSTDEETIPDPETLSDDLQRSFNLIKNSVLATNFRKMWENA